MATKRWYLANSVVDGWQSLTETAQGAASLTAGWVVSTGATFSSEHNSGAASDRAATTFVANTVPDATLDTSLKDAFRTPLLNGTFASANWTFQFAVQSPTQGGAAGGQIVIRLIRADLDGSNAVQITSAQQAASACLLVSSTDVNGTLTLNPGAFTITNQYLFVQVAWKRTVAGGMTTTNIRLRTGVSATVGTTILSSDFTPADQAVTGNTIASGSVVRVPTVSLTVIGGTRPAGSSVTAPTVAPGAVTIIGGTKTPGSSVNAPTVTQVVNGAFIYPTSRFFYTETVLVDHSASDTYANVGGADDQQQSGRILSQTISGHTGLLTSISLLLRRRIPDGTGAIYLEVRESTQTGLLLGRSLVQSNIVESSTTPAWVNFPLPGVALSAGTTYWINIHTTAPVLSAREELSVDMTLDSSYAGGELRTFDGIVINAAFDATFILYTGTGLAVSLPAITQAVAGATCASTLQVHAPAVAFPSTGPPFIKTVTIDHTQVGTADLTDFPVTIACVDSDFKTIAHGGYASSSLGYDIRPFADFACTTALDFELVEYDSATGWIELHVKLPSVSHTVDTVFYLSVGDVTFTTNASNATNTFSNGYVSVYHLKTLGMVDSLGINSAYYVGTGVSAIPAIVGGGIALDGSADSYANVGTASMPSKFPCTVSAWATDVGSMIFSRWDPRFGGNYDWYFAAGRFICQVYAGDHGDAIAGSTPSSGWHWYAGRFNGGYLVSSVQLFVDGNWSADGTSLFAYETSGAGAGVIGGQMNADGTIAPGGAINIDELRIADVSRSDGWLYAEYHNQVAGSTFLTITAISGGGGGDQTVAGATIASTVQLPTETLLLESGTDTGSWFTSGVGVGLCQTISGHTGTLTAVSLLFGRSNTSFTDAPSVEIREATVSGTLLATSLTVASADIPSGSRAWIKFQLPGGVTLVSGTTYWIKFLSSAAASAYSFALNTGNPYAGGEAKDSAGLALGSGYDFPFRLYAGGSHTVAIGPLTITTSFIESGIGPRVTDTFDLVFIGPALISVGLFPPTVVALTYLDVAGGTIASGHQRFAPTVAPGPVTVTLGTRAATSQVFTPSPITVGPVTILGATRATTSQLFVPSLTGVTSGATIPSGSQVFALSVAYAVTLGTRTTALQVNAPTVAVTVTTGTIPTGNQLFVLSVATGPVTLVGATIGSGNQRFVPTLVPGAITIGGGTIGSASAVTVPSVTVGAVTVVGATLASASQLFSPALTAIAFGAIGSESVPTTVVLNPPTVALATFFVVGATIPSASVARAPSIAYEIRGVVIGSVLGVNPPSLLTITSVVGSTIDSTLHLSAVNLAQVSLVGGATLGPTTVILPPFMITSTAIGATISATTALSPPSVLSLWFVTGMHIPALRVLTPPSVAAVITAAPISATTQLFSPTLTVVITTTTIPSMLQVFSPVVSGEVVGTSITPTSQLYSPTVLVAPQVGFISSTVTLHGPRVAPVIGVIVVGGIAPTTVLFPPAVARVFPPTTCVASEITVRYLVTSVTLECAVAAEASVQVRYRGVGMAVGVEPVGASGIQVRYLAASAGVHVCCAEVSPCELC